MFIGALYGDNCLYSVSASQRAARAGESTSSDDEDGVLATPKVQEKFLQTLQKIRSKDKSIYDPKHQFFVDEDFAETNESKVCFLSSHDQKLFGLTVVRMRVI